MIPSASNSSASRRSSILKPRRRRQPLQNVNFDSSSHENSPVTPKLKRRVSFAEKKHVKEFCDSIEQGTVWDHTYEEHDLSHNKLTNALYKDEENAASKKNNSEGISQQGDAKNAVAKIITSDLNLVESAGYNDITRNLKLKGLPSNLLYNDEQNKFLVDHTSKLTNSAFSANDNAKCNANSIQAYKTNANHTRDIVLSTYDSLHSLQNEVDLQPVTMEFTSVIPPHYTPVTKKSPNLGIETYDMKSSNVTIVANTSMELTTIVPTNYPEKEANASMELTTIVPTTCPEKVDYTSKNQYNDNDNIKLQNLHLAENMDRISNKSILFQDVSMEMTNVLEFECTEVNEPTKNLIKLSSVLHDTLYNQNKVLDINKLDSITINKLDETREIAKYGHEINCAEEKTVLLNASMEITDLLPPLTKLLQYKSSSSPKEQMQEINKNIYDKSEARSNTSDKIKNITIGSNMSIPTHTLHTNESMEFTTVIPITNLQLPESNKYIEQELLKEGAVYPEAMECTNSDQIFSANKTKLFEDKSMTMTNILPVVDCLPQDDLCSDVAQNQSTHSEVAQNTQNHYMRITLEHNDKSLENMGAAFTESFVRLRPVECMLKKARLSESMSEHIPRKLKKIDNVDSADMTQTNIIQNNSRTLLDNSTNLMATTRNPAPSRISSILDKNQSDNIANIFLLNEDVCPMNSNKEATRGTIESCNLNTSNATLHETSTVTCSVARHKNSSLVPIPDNTCVEITNVVQLINNSMSKVDENLINTMVDNKLSKLADCKNNVPQSSTNFHETEDKDEQRFIRKSLIFYNESTELQAIQPPSSFVDIDMDCEAPDLHAPQKDVVCDDGYHYSVNYQHDHNKELQNQAVKTDDDRKSLDAHLIGCNRENLDKIIVKNVQVTCQRNDSNKSDCENSNHSINMNHLPNIANMVDESLKQLLVTLNNKVQDFIRDDSIQKQTNVANYDGIYQNNRMESDTIEQINLENDSFNQLTHTQDTSPNKDIQYNTESCSPRMEPDSTTSDDPLHLLFTDLKRESLSDNCIWNVHSEDIIKQVIAVGFINNSLLCVIILSSSNTQAVKDIRMISLLNDDTNILMNIVHKLILEKISTLKLLATYKSHGDILPMLNCISQAVILVMDFMFDLQELQDVYLMEVALDRISFICRTKKMNIILKITVDVMMFDQIRPSNISVYSILGTVREKDIKELIINVKRDHNFLRQYMNDVKDYIELMEESNTVPATHC